eukprot:10163666-Heterocapsa_arctica.AAC.1
MGKNTKFSAPMSDTTNPARSPPNPASGCASTMWSAETMSPNWSGCCSRTGSSRRLPLAG